MARKSPRPTYATRDMIADRAREFINYLKPKPSRKTRVRRIRMKAR